jgi:3-hydroxybutyryl-CoA dehydrogenase
MIIGAGFMGAGIAQVCLQSGYRVILTDTGNVLEKAGQAMALSLEKLYQKGGIKEPVKAVLSRLELIEGLGTALETGTKLSWVIEAVYEDEALKKKILAEVEPRIDSGALVATNTSSIPVSRLGSALTRPEQLVGLHFFGPVPLMGLVEVVKGQLTSEKTFLQGMDFIKSLGKYPVAVTQDIPGFVMNRVFAAAFRECQELVGKGVATPEDIDAGMRLGYGWHIGPFQIADNAGLDTVLRINESMKALEETHLYSESTIIKEKVEKGRLGRKSGQGFYSYDKTP